MIEEHVIETYEEEREQKGFIRTLFSWLGKNIKFLFVPGYIPEDLVARRQKFEMLRSKRKFIRRLRSTLTIIGIGILFVLVTFAIFAPWISEYSFNELTGLAWNNWRPPSEAHPFGTTELGRDVLARTLYGIQDSLIFGAGTVLVGLIGGLTFGLLASRFTRILPTIIKSVMLVFYILPGILIALLFVSMLGPRVGRIALITGLLLIPGFTRIIANTEFRLVPIAKKVISYLPLFAGFAILLYVTIAFLGYGDSLTINLGNDIARGRYHLYDAPWATFWPGFAIFLVLISLFVLHEGLAKHSR